MATDRASDRPAPRGAQVALTFGVGAGIIAALLPVLHVVDSGPWFLGAIVIIVAVLAAGFISRRRRLPAVAVSLIEAVVWLLLITGMFFRDTALLWVLPTPETFRELPGVVAEASTEIALGAAPLTAGEPLAFVIVAATGALTLIIDHVVLTARMPLLAAVGLVAVSLIPTIVVPGDVDIVAFVLLAVTILFLMRSETRARQEAVLASARSGPAASSATSRGARAPGVAATALGIGAVAVVLSLVAAPLLPRPVAQPGGAVISGPGINATLQLGDDLRQPFESEVITLHTDASTAPYLRVTTLTRFSGDIWQPDRMRSVPLDSEEPLGALQVGEGIAQTEARTSVDVQELASPWLPIPFPAVNVEGMAGEWEAVPYNRTIVTRNSSTQWQKYTVDVELPRPTLEQIRASEATNPILRDDTTVIPDDLPENISALATEVTADTENDYDALIALQRWFRGSDFTYSLEAPVEDGFDGSGADAVSQFLEVRSGYCVHFASAFALMARTLDMPSRIVVGYLPGTSTDEQIDSETVYSVSSSQLHSWPEVYFDDIGWIPFEPTNGLGVPTRFASAASAEGTDDELSPTASPTASASSTAQTRPDEQDTQTQAGGAGSTGGSGPLPAIGTVIGILIALLVPAAIRLLRRTRLLGAARTGDGAAAWLVTQEAAIDLSIDVPAGESPRAFGARLVGAHGAAADDVRVLVGGIERASYAPGGALSPEQGAAVADAAAAVRSQLFAAVGSRQRLLATVIPRSLVVRPGSMYAGTGTGAPAR